MVEWSREKNPVRWVGLKQLKEVKAAAVPKDAGEGRFTPVPMFLPTRTFNHAVASVVTREKFIHTSTGWWLKWRVSGTATIVFGILAIAFIPINLFIAAIFGVAAGWMYGTHTWSNFYVNMLLKNRMLLEST